jgi:itaconate CoA-transferase
MAGALDKLLVVALEQAVAAPLCSRKMAEAGARVIKIEAASGDFARHYDNLVDGQSTYFTWLNVGKESVAVDLRSPADRQLVLTILQTADVFLQNLRPGSAAAMGFEHSRLRAQNPRLIACDIVGFARPKEEVSRKAYDLLIQAEAGLASVTGTPGEPSRVGISVVDIATGLTAYQAILEALLRRSVTHQGDSLEIAMFDCMAEWMSVPLLYTTFTGREPPKLGLKHPTIAPYGAFVCGDGVWLLIAVQQDREWLNLCSRVLERPDLTCDTRFATNTARVAHRDLVDRAIAACLAKLAASEAMRLLRGADIAFARVGGVADLLGHPGLRTFDVRTPGGTVSLPVPAERGLPGCPSATAATPRVPACDEHGAAIREEFALQH